ncbi:hypothetical protein GCM10010472_09710 [Pseudonocardia halophobica]|uniref:Peptidase A4 family protein n=1 Tax=Pseudonocardia halophobica TaxID=29401 RepID=A0A9W6L761_9PSEU|nr:G1 family glutamic endopeptidase [Pseudonocardia halophobica]GLL14343.1 hypothetical protein GCM10017577_54900 [Pseudonocardia halophobica]
MAGARGRHGRRVVGALVAAAGAVLLLLAPPGDRGAATEAAPAPVAHAGYQPVTGSNWSGWAAVGSGFTTVSAAWSAPTVRCGAPTQVVGPWVGLGGVVTNTVQQTGLEITCASGKPVYRAWYETAPQPPVYHPDPVGPGDRMTASVHRTATGYTLTIADTTRGWTRTAHTAHLQDDHASAEVVVESPTGAFPAFGSLTLSGATVDGRPLASTDPVGFESGTTNVRQTRTGPVRGGTFTVSYLHE